MLPAVISIIASALPSLIEQVAKAPQMQEPKAKVTAEEITKQVIEAIKVDPTLQPKPIVASKSFWWGMLNVVAPPAIAYLAQVDFSTSNLGLPIVVGLMLNGVVQIALRYVTTRPIG